LGRVFAMPTDLQALQGTWRVTSFEVDGHKVPASALGDSKIVVTGAQFRSVGMGATYEGTLKLGRAGTSRTLDLVFAAGPEAGRRNLGIYTLDGDTWTLCLATRGSQRPARFATKAGTGFALETLTRGRAPRKRGTKTSPPLLTAGTVPTTAESRAAASASATELEGEWAMVSGVFSGVALDNKMVQWCRRLTRGHLTTVVAGPQIMLSASFTLNPSSRPAHIDYLNLYGASAGKAQMGIVTLSGKTLSICMAAPGKPRPTDFSSKPGDGRSSTTWRRATKQGRG
jgi:uncharacterized protein (TIGR03067 family)